MISPKAVLQKVLEGKLKPKKVCCTSEHTDNSDPNILHQQNPKKRNTQTLPPLTAKPNVTEINNHLSLISLNINGFNSPI